MFETALAYTDAYRMADNAALFKLAAKTSAFASYLCDAFAVTRSHSRSTVWHSSDVYGEASQQPARLQWCAHLSSFCSRVSIDASQVMFTSHSRVPTARTSSPPTPNARTRRTRISSGAAKTSSTLLRAFWRA